MTRVRTDGSVNVRTAAGEATIQINPRQIPAFVRPGTVVSLILQRTENGLQALLQPRSPVPGTAAAKPVSGTQQAGTAATGSATSTTASAPRTLPPLTDGQVARAIVLRPTSLPQGIAGGPIPATASSINPQQAAQAAARYLLASSPHLKPSSTLPTAPQAVLPQATPPSPAPTGAQPVSNTAQQAQPPAAQPASGQQSPPATIRSPAQAQTGTVNTGTISTGATPASQNTPAPSPGTAASAPQAPAATTVAAPAATGRPGNVPSNSVAQTAQTVTQGGSENRTATAAPAGQVTGTPATSGADTAGASAPKPGNALPPGADFPIRVLSVGAQTSNALPAQHGSGGTVISGTIVATGGSGQAIVNSSVGLLDVAARAEAGQMQSAIRMEILGRSESDMRGRIEGGSQTPLSILSREWPALEESLRALEVSAPQSAAQFSAAIARPGPQLAASMLFFLAAVRGGSLGGWLGKDTSQALEKSHGRLLSTLSGDFQSLSRASEGGPETAGWRAFFMPIQNQDALEQMRLFILPPPFERNEEETGGDGEENSNNGGDAETRFVVDLMLSGLGPFQIDGSVAKQSMSLLIRTHRALQPQMRADIIEIFEKTAGRTGMSGAVSFKVQKEFPPLPIADLMPDGRQNPDVYA